MADNPTLAQTRRKVDPSLKDLLDLYKKDLLLNLNCHAIGTIQSFDPSNQTVSATINYKKTYDQRQDDGTYITVLKDYPILLDMPAIVLSGGEWSLRFPIAKDDQCLILFNDRALDSWFQSGQVGPVPVARFHSISDGVALIGLRSMANPLENFALDHGGLYGPGQSEVSLSDSGLVKIGNGTGTLGSALQQLLTNLDTVATDLQSNPMSEPAAAAAGAALATSVASLQSLLEGILE